MTDFTDPAAAAAKAAAALRQRCSVPGIDLALVLGSGWSASARDLGELVAEVPLAELPGFSKPVVEGHGGDLLVIRTETGKLAGIFTGRPHYYEAAGVDPLAHAVRRPAGPGATTMVLTNGCGGLRLEWGPGTPVLIRDHINLTGATPLRGASFIDMSDAYSARLRELARSVAPELDEGVYVQFTGPNYETPAKVRMAGLMGGDLVGMSTTHETIAAREAGQEVLGISLVTNPAAGVSDAPLDHAEVLAAGKAAAPRLADLLRRLLAVL